jgi:hypothetical protein
MSVYESGDFVKVEFKDDLTGESEWMWMQVEHADDAQRVAYGRLDSQPIMSHGGLTVGSQLAVSYDKIRQHRKAVEF